METKVSNGPKDVGVTQVVKGPCAQPRRTQGDPHVISVPEGGHAAGISKALGYDLARRGELPGAFQLGRRWRVSLVKLRAAIHGAKDDGAEEAG